MDEFDNAIYDSSIMLLESMTEEMPEYQRKFCYATTRNALVYFKGRIEELTKDEKDQ